MYHYIDIAANGITITSQTKIVRIEQVGTVSGTVPVLTKRSTADTVLGTTKETFINSFCLSFRISSITLITRTKLGGDCEFSLFCCPKEKFTNGKGFACEILGSKLQLHRYYFGG